MASVALKSYENRIYKILHWLIQIEDESFLSARLHTHISVDLLFDSKFPLTFNHPSLQNYAKNTVRSRTWTQKDNTREKK